MTNESQSSTPSQKYSTAYTAHYTEQNLSLALRLYQELMTSHPNEPEAEYSRVQIQNIVHAVVPKQDLLDAQLALLNAHLKREHELIPENPTLPFSSRLKQNNER